MTTIESIQMNIHYAKKQLSSARSIVANDEIEKLSIQGTIEFYLNELKDLRFSLSCAIKQLS